MDLELAKEQPIEQSAFELWVVSRKPTLVVQALTQLGLNENGDITPATITSWSKQYKWPIMAKDHFKQQEPEFAFDTYSTLYATAPKAARYLDSVIDGNYDPELSDEEKTRGYVPDPTMVRVRIEAATRVLHMVGYSPNGQNKPEKPVDPFRGLSASDIREMSTEKLLELEQQRVQATQDENRSRFESNMRGRRATHS